MERNVWTILFGLIATAVLLLLAYLQFGLEGVAWTLAALLLLGALWRFFQNRVVILNEMEIGVVFHRVTGNFSRFIITPEPDVEAQAPRPLPPTHVALPGQNEPEEPDEPDPVDSNGAAEPETNDEEDDAEMDSGVDLPGSGMDEPVEHPWLRWLLNKTEAGHYIFLLRPEEVMWAKLRKGAYDAEGTITDLRTSEGIPVSIRYKISYKFDVRQILPQLRHKMARALPKASATIVSGRVRRNLKFMIEKMGIKALYTPIGMQNGALLRLEEDLRTRLNQQLSFLGVMEIPDRDVILGPISMPAPVERALRAAHERELQADTIVSLKKAIADFTDDDLRRLKELERLRILEDKARWINVTDAVVNKNKDVTKNKTVNRNGRGHTPNNGTSELSDE